MPGRWLGHRLDHQLERNFVMQGPRDRRRASALQRALERYERLLAEGSDPARAKAEAGASLRGPDASAFILAAGLREVGERSTVVPDPAFAEALALRLRNNEMVRRPRVRARPRLGFVPLAAAACVAIFAALLVPAMRSLPGDGLYGLKGLSEDARLLFATGSTEARVRLDLAEERFSEVLIEDTLREAGKHLEAAADILTTKPSEAQDLDELVEVSRRGHALATEFAEDLPNGEQPPVLVTVVKLAKIEAAAKAARTQVATEPTLPACATPTPTPEATESSDAEVAATSTAVEATPEPTETPQPTPCTTPEPTPTPQPTDAPTADPSTEPTLTPGVVEGVDGADGGDDFGSDDDAANASESGTDPSAA
jgi:hypothetical protein